MKKFIIPLLTVVMVVSIILTGCAPALPPEEPELPPEEPELPPTALSKPGEWAGQTEFGKLVFTVAPDSTGISKISLHFEGEFKCGGSSVSDGQATVEKLDDVWPITNGQFSAEFSLLKGLWNVVIEGEFDQTGTQASGTWEISSGEGTTCQEGTWEASAP